MIFWCEQRKYRIKQFVGISGGGDGSSFVRTTAGGGGSMMIPGSAFALGAAQYHTSYPTFSVAMRQIIPAPVGISNYSTKKMKQSVLVWMEGLSMTAEGSLSP